MDYNIHNLLKLTKDELKEICLQELDKSYESMYKNKLEDVVGCLENSLQIAGYYIHSYGNNSYIIWKENIDKVFKRGFISKSDLENDEVNKILEKIFN